MKSKTSSQLNKSCFCGSKKKFKDCCKKKFINFTPSYLKLWADEVNSTEEGSFELFKIQYSKFVSSFYVDLIDKGNHKIGNLVSKYNDLWQEYCGFLDHKFPEMEAYFVKNVSKYLQAELTTESG